MTKYIGLTPTHKIGHAHPAPRKAPARHALPSREARQAERNAHKRSIMAFFALALGGLILSALFGGKPDNTNNTH